MPKEILGYECNGIRIRKVAIMHAKLMGKKVGMMQIFDEAGVLIPCTVISLEPNVVVQVKNKKKDGYGAIQLGAVRVRESKKRNLSKPLLGHFAAAKVEPRRHLFESQPFEGEEMEVGKEIGIETFKECSYVDVIGTSKGKGFQGVIKRYNFKGGPGSHGSHFHRSGGSTGMRSTPGRCFLRKKPGRMGGERVTVEALKVVEIDMERKVLLVKGAIPGPIGGSIWLRKSIKRPKKKKRGRK